MLWDHRLYANFFKCEFWLKFVTFFGYMVSGEGISVDPIKVKAFITAFILTLPVEGERFVVYYDTSHVWLGCLLMQQGPTIAYGSC